MTEQTMNDLVKKRYGELLFNLTEAEYLITKQAQEIELLKSKCGNDRERQLYSETDS